MITRSAVSVEEYLHSGYEPDMDYVEGELIERNMGEKDHGRLQFKIAMWIEIHCRNAGIFQFIEQRIQVSERRFRVPDVCVYVGTEPNDQVFHTPPLVCIEILSPDDRVARIRDKIRDYMRFGVRYVWVVDPKDRSAWIYTSEGAVESKDGVLRTQDPEIVVPLPEIFAEIDAEGIRQTP
jgi:Uma2 family endonuclease